MGIKINASIRDAAQKSFVKLFKNDGKDYITATIALSPATVKWIVEISRDLGDDEYFTLRGNLFQSKDDAPSAYDGVAKPYRVGDNKVEYLG
jgi:hypothetical protein